MVKHLKEGKDLVEWLEREEILFQLSVYEANILLGYLEGNGYSLESEGSQLYICDDVNDSQEKTDIYEVAEKVCETNYILIQDSVEKLAKAENNEDTTDLESLLLNLYLDETKLDNISDRMKRRRECEGLPFAFVKSESKTGAKRR